MIMVSQTIDSILSLSDYFRYIDFIKVLLCAIILVLSILYLWTYNYQDLPPGSFGYPLIGNLKVLQDKPHIRLTNLKEKYGDIYCLKIGKHIALVICSWGGVQEGLPSDTWKFIGRPDIFSSNVLFSGDRYGGICFSDPDLKYKVKKDFVLRSLDNICCESKMLVTVIQGETERLICFLLAQEKPMDIRFAIESTMLRIMMFVVNGKLYEPNDENFLEILKTFRSRHELYSDNWSVFVPLLHRLKRNNSFDVWERIRLQFEYQRNIVNRHKDQFNPKIVSDMIDHILVMLEANEDMGVLDQDDLDLLFVEMSGSGYRALAATFLWFLLYMASFPDIQKKVYEEIISVVGKGRLPQLSDQPYLPYTCAVLMETHRLATVMPFLYPHKTMEPTDFMGYNIPADTMILFNIWSIHHDPRYWKQPMKFNPDRFLKLDGTLCIPDHFMPFGDGIRGCPGESLADIQLFLFATHFVSQLNLTLPVEVDLEGVYKGYILYPKTYQLQTSPRDDAMLDEASNCSEDYIPEAHTVISLFESDMLSIPESISDASFSS